MGVAKMLLNKLLWLYGAKLKKIFETIKQKYTKTFAVLKNMSYLCKVDSETWGRKRPRGRLEQGHG